jgi:hypothetical protein
MPTPAKPADCWRADRPTSVPSQVIDGSVAHRVPRDLRTIDPTEPAVRMAGRLVHYVSIGRATAQSSDVSRLWVTTP